MEYVSTSSPQNGFTADFREMFYHPVAPDGGIYMPQSIPTIPSAVFKNLEGMSLTDCAYIITAAILGQDIDPSVLREATASALDFEIPLQHLSDDIMSLELFHGPTLGVRDLGTRFLAAFMSRYDCCSSADRRVNVIAATAGDTGMALADAMKDVPGAHVYILHPRDESGRDKRTGFMLSGENATSIEVKGSLDQCMGMLYELLSDREFTDANNLVSGNTLNFMRLLPVIVTFFHAKAQMHRTGACKPDDPIVFALPSGSLATLAAGVIAKRMGLGNVRFVTACSKGHSFSRFLRTGVWQGGNAEPSIAGALDVSYPGNLPRLFAMYGNSAEAMSEDISAVEVSDDEIRAAMRQTLSRYDYLTDPHTAATMYALESRMLQGEKGVILASVHPAKFGSVVQENTQTCVVAPKRMERIKSGSAVRQLALPPTVSALKKFLREQNLQKPEAAQ